MPGAVQQPAVHAGGSGHRGTRHRALSGPKTPTEYPVVPTPVLLLRRTIAWAILTRGIMLLYGWLKKAAKAKAINAISPVPVLSIMFWARARNFT